MHGVGDAPKTVRKAVKNRRAARRRRRRAHLGERWEGILAYVQRRYDETSSDGIRLELDAYMVAARCPACDGRRLRPESLAVTLHGQDIGSVVQLSVVDALGFFETVPVRGAAGRGSMPASPARSSRK
jgi:excinuclease ABC subunit A